MIDLKLVVECVQKIRNASTLDEVAQVIVTILHDRNDAVADKALFEKRWNDTVEERDRLLLHVDALKKLNVDESMRHDGRVAALVIAIKDALPFMRARNKTHHTAPMEDAIRNLEEAIRPETRKQDETRRLISEMVEYAKKNCVNLECGDVGRYLEEMVAKKNICEHEWEDVKISSIRGLQKCRKCPEKRMRPNET